MRKLKYFLLGTFLCAGMLAATSCGDDDEDEPNNNNPGTGTDPATQTVAVTGVEVSPTAVTLEAGKTISLTATVKPDNATDKAVTWTSSDEAIATVKDGTVTAVKEGEATITAKAGDKTAECKVTVTAPAAKNFTVTFDSDGGSAVTTQTVEEGKTANKPEDPAKENFTFAGWLDASGAPYDFAAPVTADITLTASWTENATPGPNPGGDVANGSTVDLGLPSGLLWTTCNIGASKPEEYGDYYAWGETETKDYYSWETYKYADGSYDALTKYCNQSSYGKDGFTDDLTVLEADDDVATVKLGANYSMPTNVEWNELFNSEYTYNTWIYDYNGTGVAGRIVYKKASGAYTHEYTLEDAHIFLPAAGYRTGSDLRYAGGYGFYWSSSLRTGRSYSAYYRSDYNFEYRYGGFPVRAVRRK